MFGWFFLINRNKQTIINNNCKIMYNEFGISCGFTPHNRFENDKVYLNNEQYIAILDGVVFNNTELIRKFNQKNWQDTIIYMYETLGEKFYEVFRGSFNGIIYSKKTDEFVTFTNHIGDRTVFYYVVNKQIIVSSNLNLLEQICKDNNIEVSLDQNYIKYMLTFGFMLDNTTFYQQVKRLMPGEFITYKNKEIDVKEYFKFDNSKELQITEDEAIKLIDSTFRKALKREMDKDTEYGYKSIVDISGGLDSRAVNYVCKKLDYNNILNLSYSQMDSNEYKVTKKLVNDLENDYIFKSLNNCSFIYEVDKLIEMNYGLTIYSAFTGGRQLLETLDMSNMGIEHTGLLGDINDGSFSDFSYHKEPFFQKKYRFPRLLDINILDKKILKDYKNHEMFCFYTRGLLGGLGTHLIRQNYTETFSPFEDVDFLKLTFELPLKMRVDGHIFRKWLIKCYPEATKIEYDHTMCKITDNRIKIFLKKVCLKGPNKLKRIMGINVLQKETDSMNPFEYWYNNNEKVRIFIDDYYKENKYKLEKNPELLDLINQIYVNGTAIDKMSMITVLAVMKRYFN